MMPHFSTVTFLTPTRRTFRLAPTTSYDAQVWHEGNPFFGDGGLRFLSSAWYAIQNSPNLNQDQAASHIWRSENGRDWRQIAKIEDPNAVFTDIDLFKNDLYVCVQEYYQISYPDGRVMKQYRPSRILRAPSEKNDLLSIRHEHGLVVLEWENGTLEESDSPKGNWNTIDDTSPISVRTTKSESYYRLITTE